MNQKRFLQELAYYLRQLPKPVREDIMETYRDQFKIGEIEGRSEEDICLLLGRPQAVAEKELAIHADQLNYRQEEPDADDFSMGAEHPRQKQTNVGLLIGVIIFNLIFVVGPAVGIGFTIIGFWIASIVLMATPLFGIWQTYLYTFPHIFILIATFGLGLLWSVGNYYLTKLSVWLTGRYINLMGRIVKG
ncbi:Uncharacterized membrane protein [Amphibacillus marinus]|uniref:Uncharacterized membrane protein n=1 Tax=Amphibacillus marinus TaxID=872970 RepID=A0A1H8MWZ7_9BACI|nr:DUF1700 domain-containing protein [Amphibacillus marinus]SEO21852.1 Uncharacterized membrane protein [Amphibacillus marinus]